jgi:hydrogenase-4 component E
MNIIYTVIYLLSALIVVTGFYIQANKYLRSMVMTQALQSFIIALIAFLLGIALDQYTFFILGILVILLRTVLVTYFIIWKIPKNKSYLYESKLPTTYYLLIDLAFIVISIFIVYSISFIHIVSHIFPDSDIILFPLLLFFQGLFIIASRKRTIAQILGYIEEENSLILLGTFILPVPIIIESSVFLDVLILVVIFSIISMEKAEHKPMEELRG